MPWCGGPIRLAVSIARVHGDVVDVALVREQADLEKAVPRCFDLGMPQQQAAETPALPAWVDGHVLDPQVVGLRLELDHADRPPSSSSTHTSCSRTASA